MDPNFLLFGGFSNKGKGLLSLSFVIKVDSVDHLNLVNPFPKPHKLTAQFRVSGVTSTDVLVWREDADWFLDLFHCNVVRTSDQYQ